MSAKTPPPQELAASLGIGAIDVANFEHISGWAWNPDDPDESVMVELLDGDQSLAVVKADLYREDLQSMGLGNGKHGFMFAFSATLFPFARHTLRVRRVFDGSDLRNSPKVLERDGTALDRSSRRYVEGLFTAEAAAAKSSEELNYALAFAVDQLGLLIRRQAELAAQQGSGPDLGELGNLIDSVAPTQWVAAAGQSMANQYPPVVLPTWSQPKVSIIIPVYGKFKLTYDCIKSIQDHLPKASFEVIVVDDCSKDETLLAPLVFGGSVRVVRNESNLGFVKGCNRGADLARGEYLFFLNNDTLVRPGWMDTLVDTFKNVDNVGVVGSKLIFGDGSLQEVGGIIWRMADGWNWGRNCNPDEPRFNYLRDSDYVSGASLMIPAALFREMNGFDLEFAPAYYEDTDLCFRVRQRGLRVVVQPQSVIVHLEGQSAGTSVTGTGMKRFQAINHRKFYDRWKGVLAAHRFNGEQPDLECERKVSKRAIFIDESVPTPDQDAGSNAALQHMKSLMRLGYKVTFIPADNMAKISPYTEALQALGVECIYYPFYWSVEEYFRKNRMPVDVVYLHRFSNATKYAGMVRGHQPKAQLIYNVADLHYLRMEREAELTGSAEVAKRAATMRHDELTAVQAVDVTIVHSAVEKAVLAEVAPSGNVHVVPWSYRLRPVQTPVTERSGVMFVGGYGHPPNVDAAKWLVNEIMPLVWRELPNLPVTLVGSKMPDEVKALGSSLVEALGYTPDVNDVYERRLVSVAPLRYGAGVKGKVLEAFAAGIPCVMTTCAAEGVELSDDLQALVGNDAEGLARRIIDLHNDLAACEQLSHAGLAMMASRYSAEAVDAAIGRTVVKKSSPS